MRPLVRLSWLTLALLVGCRAPSTVPERLLLSPGELSLQFGEAKSVTASVFVGTKQTSLEGLSWSSSDETLVTVTPGTDGTASIQGLNAGTATITAKVREATATLNVTVAARVIVLERIDLTPAAPSLAKGLKLQLQADGIYNDGSHKDLTSTVAWASADGARATVNAAGLATAVSPGSVELRAQKSGITGRVTLTVTAATVVALEVRPAQLTLAKGSTLQCSVLARLSDGTSQDVTSQATWTTASSSIASVSATGRVTANDVGMTALTATLGTLTGSADVTVTSAVLRSLDVTPGTATLPLGTTQQLTLTGHYSDGTQQDVTAMGTWHSGTAAVASVDANGLVTALGLGLSVVTATIDSITGGSSITCTAPQLQTIHVAPQNLMLAKGLSRPFTATGIYTDTTTRDLTGGVIWSSDDAGIASVDSAGVVQANTEGVANIIASNGMLMGSAALTVAPALLVSIQLTPASTTSVAAGLTKTITAQGTFSDGSHADVTSLLTWDSSATGVASVSSTGVVTGVTQGTANITATQGAASASLTVTVGAPVLQTLEVTAPVLSLAKGRTQQLTATGVYSDASRINETANVTWTPATGTVLSVSSAGLLTAVQVGTALATATLGTVSGALSLDVTAAAVDGITVSPAAPTIPLGRSQTMVANTVMSDGTSQPLSTGVTWDSATTSVATVNASGVVSSLLQGQSVVTATFGTFSAQTTVTVGAPVVDSLALSPANPTLDKLQTQQLTVEATYSDGSHGPVAVSWLSSKPAVATVDAAGLVVAVTPGTTTITATFGSTTGTTVVSVNRPPLQSLTVTPSPATVTVNGTVAFSALATYVDTSTESVTSLVSWSSSDTAIATIDATGVASGVAPANVTITAQWLGSSGTSTLTVNPRVLQSIVVSGRSRFAVGSATQLVATGTYNDSTTSDVTAQATWTSSAPASMKFDNLTGLFGIAQGLSAGVPIATATVGAVSGAVSVNVLDTNAPYVGRCGTGLVISQVFGGGNNANQRWANDFVELHNPTPNPISVSGLSLQYASSTAASTVAWTVFALNAPQPISAGGFFLVQLAGSGTGTPVPSPDQTGTGIDMASANGKIALVRGTTAMTGCGSANIIDLFGWGNANCSEGSAAPAGVATAWFTRGVSACRDGNQNGADFTSTTTVLPRNSGSPAVLCSCYVNELNITAELSACQLLSAATLNAAAGAASPEVTASVTETGLTDTAGFSAALQVQVGFGPTANNPVSTTGTGWQWWPATGRTAGTTSDEYVGVFLAPPAGTQSYTARASKDGVNWTACDLNSAGSATGVDFEAAQLGVLSAQ